MAAWKRRFSISLAVVACATFADPALAPQGQLLDVQVDPATGKYGVFINDNEWLTSAPVRAFVENKWHDQTVGTLQLVGNSSSSGADAMGQYTALSIEYKASSTSFFTIFKKYATEFVFETQFPAGARGTASRLSKDFVPGGWPGDNGNIPPIVSFPAFDPSSIITADNFGLLTWAGVFCGEVVSKNSSSCIISFRFLLQASRQGIQRRRSADGRDRRAIRSIRHDRCPIHNVSYLPPRSF
jgi:hypothetical protein